MRQLIQDSKTGERRVIDRATMMASEWLAEGDDAAPLADYNLDGDLAESDTANYVVIREDRT